MRGLMKEMISMSLIRYSPSVMGLQQQINRMFHEFDSSLFDHLEGLRDGLFAPAVDVKEDDAAYTVHLEVPGVSQSNIDLQLHENVLTVRGRKEQKQESGEGRYRRVERSYGTFSRSLSLPRNVDDSAVTANLENGVLEVRLPKREAARPRQISVGTTQDAVMQDSTAQDASSQNGAAQDASSQNGAAHNVAVQDGAAHDVEQPSPNVQAQNDPVQSNASPDSEAQLSASSE